jgi:PAS domain S-box-containing protein
VGGATTTVRPPALALIGADRRIVRSTESFRRRYEHAGVVCEASPEVELVLTGQADAATVSAGDISVAIEAVTDTNGTRHAMLSLPADEQPPLSAAPIAALREPLDESPAIVWVKDLDGRYLYINSRYENDLGTSEERLRGRTDAELPRREAVDGPRAQYPADGVDEPIQLEYVVPAFEGRPALVALRFVMQDPDGHPVGICGVAAPLNEAHRAREEAARLMRVERLAGLDPGAVRAEVLEEWGVARGDRGSEPQQGQAWVAPAAGGATEQSDANAWPAAVARATEPLPTEPEPVVESAEGLQQQRDRELEQGRGELEQARAETQAARGELELARREREQARGEREQAWAEREQARGEREQARSEAAAARERGDGLASALAQLRVQLADLAR